MKTLPCLISAAVMMCLAQAQPPRDPAAGLRVFTVGHSFDTHVPAMVVELARSAGFTEPSIAGRSLTAGASLNDQWLIPDPNPIKEALMAGSVDVLALTPIYLPDDGLAKFTQFASEHNRGLRVIVQESWLPFDEYQPAYYSTDPATRTERPAQVDRNGATAEGLKATHARYFAEMDEMVSFLNRNLRTGLVNVVPVGQAAIALREKIILGEVPGLKSQDDLFADAVGNPKPILQLLSAYCHYAVIYGKNPEGLPVPPVLRLYPDEQAAPLNAVLQKIAWDQVTSHPLSGLGR